MNNLRRGRQNNLQFAKEYSFKYTTPHKIQQLNVCL